MSLSLKSRVMKLLPRSLAGQLHAWKIRRMITAYSTRVVEHTYGQYRLKVCLADPLSEGWYDHDWPELPELAALQERQLRPGARVFDLGAHQGIVAMMLAEAVGPTGHVVAVEALPHNAAAATANRDLNGLHQMEVVAAAVSDRAGTLVFNESLNGQIDDGTGAGGRLRVSAVTIDGLADRFGIPNVVFVDVEGAECRALAGAERVLASGADFVVEVHVGWGLEKLGGSVATVLAHFPRSQFDLLVRAEEDSAFRPLDADDDPVTRSRFYLIASPRVAAP